MQIYIKFLNFSWDRAYCLKFVLKAHTDTKKSLNELKLHMEWLNTPLYHQLTDEVVKLLVYYKNLIIILKE